MSKEKIGGYHEQLPSRHLLGDMYLELFSHSELYNTTNLPEIQYLHDHGAQLIMMGNHRSNADAPILERTLEIHGYQDLSDDLVFLLGQRLKETRGSEYFSHAYSHIDVWPPTMIPRDDEEKKIAGLMSRNSLKDVRQKLAEGKIITVFPEGTRSRDGNMLPFNPQIARFAHGESIFVIPFALNGTETIWPVSKSRPDLSPKTMFHANHATVNIGQPFYAADFLEGEGAKAFSNLMHHTETQVRMLYDQIS